MVERSTIMKIIQISAIWCNSCLVMQKKWQQAQKKFPNIEWNHLDLDFDEEEVSKYQVGEKLPVLIFEKEGIELSRLIGEKSEEEVLEWIKQNTES